MASKNDSNGTVNKPKYTVERGYPGAFEGETVTRRGFVSALGQGLGGVAGAAIGLPALGFALGPVFEKQVKTHWEDVGAVGDFTAATYVPKIMTLVPGVGEAGKTAIYVRHDPGAGPKDPPFIAISTRCAHLGCPVKFVSAANSFICPCHGGTYGFQGEVTGGPPVRPLDRFYTRVVNGRVEVGERFSVDSDLKRYEPRDPGEHLDGIWHYLYPPRFTT